MLELSTIDLFLSISEGEMIEGMIIGLLASPQLAIFFKKFPRIKKALNKDIFNWKKTLHQKIQKTKISAELASEFYFYQQCSLENNTIFTENLSTTVEKLEELHSLFAIQARTLVNATDLGQSKDGLQTLFLQRWRDNLILQTVTIHHQLLEQEQEQLLAELQQRLANSSALEPLLAENDTSTSRLWDMSKGQLQQGDYQLLLKYGKYLQQQPELEKLAHQLGRSKIATVKPQADTKFELHRVMERQPDVIPEEISRIHQSNDILRLLPTELAMLAIDELEYEFYRRLLERRLLTYRLQGDSWKERIISKPITHQKNDPQPRGPFIVCVDTSGSMGGFNEQCAKAFCLALLRIALADNRRCHIMLFTTEIIHYELTEDRGLEQAIKFLGQRFRGGTDLAFCLTAMLKKMEDRAWYDADAVVISDFIAQRLPEDVINNVKRQQKNHQHHFHAVAMSAYGKPGIMHIFDYIWHFDTELKSRLIRRWKR